LWPKTPLRRVIEGLRDRVMLVNPVGKRVEHARRLSAPSTPLTLHEDRVDGRLSFGLRKFGKKVKLRFYDEPFWKLVALGDYVWVQHCHSGFSVRQQPEYVFALERREPRHGLYVPFYMTFLNQWNDARHPEYDFDTNELVYRDTSGKETRREILGVPIDGAATRLLSPEPPAVPAAEAAALLRRPAPERTTSL
jgi:hypothetical protein